MLDQCQPTVFKLYVKRNSLEYCPWNCGHPVLSHPYCLPQQGDGQAMMVQRCELHSCFAWFHGRCVICTYMGQHLRCLYRGQSLFPLKTIINLAARVKLGDLSLLTDFGLHHGGQKLCSGRLTFSGRGRRSRIPGGANGFIFQQRAIAVRSSREQRLRAPAVPSCWRWNLRILSMQCRVKYLRHCIRYIAGLKRSK
jgi:hypothetical protein